MMVGDTEEQRRGGHHGGKRASLKCHTVSSLATVCIKEERQREQTTVDGDGLGRYRTIWTCDLRALADWKVRPGQ